METVLAADVERSALLAEENALLSALDAARSGSEAVTANAYSVSGLSSTTAAGSGNDATEASSGSATLDVVAAERRLRAVGARLEAIDAYTAEARASIILAGLQFTPETQTWATKSLSGGWRMRCALACALFVQRAYNVRVQGLQSLMLSLFRAAPRPCPHLYVPRRLPACS